jgi:hypothetical protein
MVTVLTALTSCTWPPIDLIFEPKVGVMFETKDWSLVTWCVALESKNQKEIKPQLNRLLLHKILQLDQ